MTTTPRALRQNTRSVRRFSICHGGARTDTQLVPRPDRLCSTNARALGRTDLLSNRIGLDQCPQSLGHNSHTSSAAIKSP